MGIYEEHKFGEEFLDYINEWIVEHFSIDELYGKQAVLEWLEDNAEEYGYVKEE